MNVAVLYEGKGDSTFKGLMNGEEENHGWVRPTSRHLSREFVRRYGVRNSRSFVSKYSCCARFKVSCLCISRLCIIQRLSFFCMLLRIAFLILFIYFFIALTK